MDDTVKPGWTTMMFSFNCFICKAHSPQQHCYPPTNYSFLTGHICDATFLISHVWKPKSGNILSPSPSFNNLYIPKWLCEILDLKLISWKQSIIRIALDYLLLSLHICCLWHLLIPTGILLKIDNRNSHCTCYQ